MTRAPHPGSKRDLTPIFSEVDPGFRAGINGTSAIVRTLLEKEPMSGAFFVFRNELGHMLRILIQTKNRVASG